MQFQLSKAYNSWRYFICVLIALRCTDILSHVEPISTRLFLASMFIKEVIPQIWLFARSRTEKGIIEPILCKASRLLISSSTRSALGIWVYQSLCSDCVSKRDLKLAQCSIVKGINLTCPPSKAIGVFGSVSMRVMLG